MEINIDFYITEVDLVRLKKNTNYLHFRFNSNYLNLINCFHIRSTTILVITFLQQFFFLLFEGNYKCAT